jgi:hypothetical protein
MALQETPSSLDFRLSWAPHTNPSLQYSVALGPQLMLGCGWYAPLLTRSVNTRLGLCGAWGGALDVGAVSPLVAEAVGDLWLMSADGAAMAGRVVVEVGWRRCCLETAEVRLLFTEARLVRRAVQWRPMKPESWSSWFLLKSLPTGSCRCCGLQNVPREHAGCACYSKRGQDFHVYIAFTYVTAGLFGLYKHALHELNYVLLYGREAWV